VAYHVVGPSELRVNLHAHRQQAARHSVH
jgi:hypothetical protein